MELAEIHLCIHQAVKVEQKEFLALIYNANGTDGEPSNDDALSYMLGRRKKRHKIGFEQKPNHYFNGKFPNVAYKAFEKNQAIVEERLKDRIIKDEAARITKNIVSEIEKIIKYGVKDSVEVEEAEKWIEHMGELKEKNSDDPESFLPHFLYDFLLITMKYSVEFNRDIKISKKQEKNPVYIPEFINKQLAELNKHRSYREKILALLQLKNEMENNPEDETVALEYAKNIYVSNFNEIVFARDLDGYGFAEEALIDLDILTMTYPNNEEIATIFASALYNFYRIKTPWGRRNSWFRLENLVDLYPQIDEIVLFYAMSLHNRVYDQGLEEAKKTVDQLENLSNDYSENEEIAYQYILSLDTLSRMQEPDDIVGTINRAEKLFKNHPLSDDILNQYVSILKSNTYKGISNNLIHKLLDLLETHSGFVEEFKNCLTTCKDDDLVAYALKVLEGLCKMRPKDKNLVYIYAYTYVLLFEIWIESTQQINQPDLLNKVGVFKDFIDTQSGNESIVLYYVKNLSDFIKYMTDDERYKRIIELQKYLAEYPNNSEFGYYYALYIDQFNIQNIKIDNFNNVGVALYHAEKLKKIAIKQSEEEIESTIGEIKNISKKFTDNSRIRWCYASCLTTLSTMQSGKSRSKTISELQTLAEEYSSDPELINIYERSLYWLVKDQVKEDIVSAESVVHILEDHRMNGLGSLYCLTNSLYELVSVQELKYAKKTVHKIAVLEAMYNEVFIARCLIKSLRDLALKQPLDDAMNNINTMEYLIKKYEETFMVETYIDCVKKINEKENVCINIPKTLLINAQKNTEITMIYAKYIRDIHTKDHLTDLEYMTVTYEENLEIALEYAKYLAEVSAD